MMFDNFILGEPLYNSTQTRRAIDTELDRHVKVTVSRPCKVSNHTLLTSTHLLTFTQNMIFRNNVLVYYPFTRSKFYRCGKIF